ncbi:MAG: primosomal protein N' [Odoribacter sp.]
MKFVDVVVPLAVDGMFTYSVPEELEKRVEVGVLVLVSFSGNKKYMAIVWRLHEQKPEGYEVKSLEGIAEEQVKISDLHLRFLLWLSEYYMATPGEVMRAALPVIFRLESFTSITRAMTEIDSMDLSPNEIALLDFLQPGVYVALKDVEKYLKLKNGIVVVRSLLARKYIQVKETVDEMFREKIEHFVRWKRPFSENELGTVLDGLKRAPAQYMMLCRWIENRENELGKAEFLEMTGRSLSALKGLCEKQVLQIVEKTVSRFEQNTNSKGVYNPLTMEQQQAFEAIEKAFEEKDCVLFQGVTSSGKTEVYIHLIKECISRGKQVLYMLPEIALTLQIVRRLQRVFGNGIGIYHSGMSDDMRAELWRKQCSDQPFGLILGVRSSVFLPFTQLGLIIIDEEHDVSYKQKEPAPRYNARDAAVMLGKMFGARILLGSATPSFESYQNAKTKKYGYVQLDRRYGGVQMPDIVIANIGEYRRKKLMKGSFSPLLIEEMHKVLLDGKQVILFQNRRGYSSYIQCDQCGAIPKCSHCDVSLTYYKQRHILICRYCGAIVKMNDFCTTCGTGHYREKTPGTERIEEEVGQLFPESRIARMDLDVMNSKTKFRAVIDDFEQGRTDILIGTQMVTKGLDFENVKLVGVIDADRLISFPDFRAEERAFCMLMQVSGRSGRKGEQGKVVIQATDVQNRVYSMLINGDYSSFFTQLSAERELFFYPPYGRIIQLELRHKDVACLRNAGNQLAAHLRGQLGSRVCGPAVPEVNKIRGLNRLILILKVGNGIGGPVVKSLIKNEFAELRKDKAFGSLRLFCDVDP